LELLRQDFYGPDTIPVAQSSFKALKDMYTGCNLMKLKADPPCKLAVTSGDRIYKHTQYGPDLSRKPIPPFMCRRKLSERKISSKSKRIIPVVLLTYRETDGRTFGDRSFAAAGARVWNDLYYRTPQHWTYNRNFLWTSGNYFLLFHEAAAHL